MKPFLILLLLVLFSFAAYHLSAHPAITRLLTKKAESSAIKKTIGKVSRDTALRLSTMQWQTLAGGGVAVAAITAAHEVADGVQESMIIRAKAEAGTFTGSLTSFLRYTLYILLLIFGYSIYRHFKNKN